MVMNFFNRFTGSNDEQNATKAIQKSGGNGTQFTMIDPSKAMKSTDAFSQNVLDFISGSQSRIRGAYTDYQLLNGYMSSVYMFAALRRVANLISRVKIVAEVEEDGQFVRAPENIKINRMFDKHGGQIMSQMWLNYAVYGVALAYKTKTRLAIEEEQRGTPIYSYKDGAVADLYVLDKPKWEIDEDFSYGEVRGAHVAQYDIQDIVGEKNYLEREEFVYVTDWNPEDPNRGKSVVAVAIHEAVANSAIAQWMSEYFTRGAMPFIMVSMEEEDPSLITDSDLRKYKRQFEDYWQGIGSSLRSVFFDRKLNVQQVGIPADEVSAPELNESALEGIASAVGIDRKLIVTTDGGAYAEHVQLVKRAWEDTVIPIAKKFLEAFNRDLGLPDHMKLVLDLSDIAELEADREDRSSTEISVYESGLQTWNETRTRMRMTPVEEFEGWYIYDGKPTSIENIVRINSLPPEQVRDYAQMLWDNNLARRSEILDLLGRKLPIGARDGYRQEIEEERDFVTQLWGEDLLTRSQTLRVLGYPAPQDAEEGYRSELERGADYGDWVTDLWGNNLLTRSQTIELLGLDTHLPANAPDGYSDEIGDRKQNIMDYWGENLVTKSQAMDMLGLDKPTEMVDGFINEIELKLEKAAEAEELKMDKATELWGDNLITRGEARQMLNLPPTPDDDIDGYAEEIDIKTEQRYNKLDKAVELWGENLMTKKQVLSMLGIDMSNEAVDGYQQEVDIIAEGLAEKKVQDLTSDGDEENSGGSSGWRSLNKPDTKEDWAKLINNSIQNDEPAIAEAEEDFFDNPEFEDDNHLVPTYGDDVDVIPELPRVNEKSKEDKTEKELDFDKVIDAIASELFGVKTGKNIYSTVHFTNTSQIKAVQDQLKSQLKDDQVREWTPANHYHVTLTYAKGVQNWDSIQNSLPSCYDFEGIETNGLSYFDTPDGYAIYIEVTHNNWFDTLQKSVYESFAHNDESLSMSGFSEPNKWNPHITLCYTDKVDDITEIIREFEIDNFELDISEVVVSKDDYDIIHKIHPCKDRTHDEPDGTATKYIPKRYLEQNKKQLKKMSRKSQAKKAKHYIEGTKMFGKFYVSEDNLWDSVVKTIKSSNNVDVDSITSMIKNHILNPNETKTFQLGETEELKTWRKFALKNGARKARERFECLHLDDDTSNEIRSKLEDARTKGDIVNIFKVYLDNE